MYKLLASCLLIALGQSTLFAQDAPRVIPLWTTGAPGFESRRNEPEQAAGYWVKNVHNAKAPPGRTRPG